MTSSFNHDKQDSLELPVLNPESVVLSKQANKVNIQIPKKFHTFSKKLKLSFTFKLGITLFFVSVWVAIASIFSLQSSIQKNLLKPTAEELKKIGSDGASSFSKEDIAAIKELAAQMNSQRLPLSQNQITSGEKIVEIPGLSKEVHGNIVTSKAYQKLARKLGDITNKSRRDDSDDVYIKASYLIGTAPQSPDRKVVRLLASDEGYRYEENSTKNKNDFVGDYYFPISPSICRAFDGQPQVDSQYYYEYKGKKDAYISAAIPLKDDTNNVVAVLNLDVDVSSIAIELSSIKWTCLQIIGSSFLVSLLVASLLSKWLVKPIRKLCLASEQIRKGDFNVNVDVQTNDEFQQLAEVFNAMVAEVRQYTNNLQHLVEERTEQLHKAKSELETDIEKGQELQRNFLPDPILTLPNWEISATFEPAKKVAGDFYDVFLLPNGDIGLVIADVCDKGVGAAMFMGLFRSFIRLFSGGTNFKVYAPETTDPRLASDSELTSAQKQALQAIEITNKYISVEHGGVYMFATIFFGVLNPETGLLTYINGGHESPLIINSSGIKAELKSTGRAVGAFQQSQYEIQQIQLEPGDILLGYTDGLTDARSPNGELFTSPRVRSLLNQPYASASELMECIKTNVFTHIDSAAQFDDITLLAVRRETPT